MPTNDDVREWAGTTEDMHDLHRFGPNQQARCDPAIRTHSRITDRDEFREPHMTLRSRAQIAGHWAAHRYRFCVSCTNTTQEPPR
ncbi:hypothetical protein [Streptomyces sp. OR43]|uniref:hypothetical protein n=1 Tax=Streptomyces sp. or43 TaxID=2478957 RepID=UPI0011CE467C|nr:hypothetical protein [Streptomyces sp. or43]TXS34760.1 hypothetical protein EAO72_40905 [Streptomyces sp. or43]